MKYLVVVETEDYIEVEAETEEEARDKAIAEMQSHGLHEWTASVISGANEPPIDCDIPF